MTVDEFGNWDPGPLQPDEKLFIDMGRHAEMACLDYDLSEGRYIVSFREAGEVLTTYVMQHGMQDLLLFPILFSYRHWLELQLKSLIALGARWRDEQPEPVHTHKLEVLWPRARAAIEQAFPEDPADLDTVEYVIDELIEIDPESMSFRYARDRKGKTNLPEGLARVNVAHIAMVMLQVGMVLDGAATGMEEMIGAMDDFRP